MQNFKVVHFAFMSKFSVNLIGFSLLLIFILIQPYHHLRGCLIIEWGLGIVTNLRAILLQRS